MDVERTIEFILQQQAKAEVRAALAEAKAERQMAAIRKLIQTGMRMIVKNEELIKATAAEVREVAAAQRATEAELRSLAAAQKTTQIKLQGFIDSLRRGRNGSHRKN